MKLLVRWLINAISLLIVAHFVRGFVVHGFVAALVAAIVIGLLNATFGLFLKIVTFPLTILTLGLFLIVINPIVLNMAAAVTPGFRVDSCPAAIIGAIVLTLFSWLLPWLIGDKPRQRPEK